MKTIFSIKEVPKGEPRIAFKDIPIGSFFCASLNDDVRWLKTTDLPHKNNALYFSKPQGIEPCIGIAGIEPTLRYFITSAKIEIE